MTSLYFNPYRLPHPVPESLREEFCLYATLAKGRDEPHPARRLEGLLTLWYDAYSEHNYHPFRIINMLCEESLIEDMEEAKLGLYKKRSKQWRILASRDVEEWTLDRLLTTPGFGPKISRLIAGYLWDEKVAILDRHIILFLRALGYGTRIVYNKGKQRWEETYRKVEVEFLKIAEAMGIHPLDLDDAIWRSGKPDMMPVYGQQLMALDRRSLREYLS